MQIGAYLERGVSSPYSGSFAGVTAGMYKRGLDLLMALVLLIFLSPALLVLMLVNRCVLGRPIFFHQVRAGRHGKEFCIHKFRTMLTLDTEWTSQLDNTERLTRWGQWLRASSLDELPELWNVLKGDMSLVGPRPLLAEYVPLYSPAQKQRLDVLPGITGWAQINGRNAVSWEERFELDVWYVQNRSVWLDLKILGLTVIRVLRRSDITPHGQTTMPPFQGSQGGEEAGGRAGPDV